MKKLELRQSVECKTNNSKSFNAPSRKGMVVYQKQAYFFSVYKDQVKVAIQAGNNYSNVAIINNDGETVSMSKEWHGIVFGYNWEDYSSHVYQEIEVEQIETIKQEVVMETKNELVVTEAKNEASVSEKKEMVSSLELVKQINIFREQEGNKSELLHKNLLAVIRDEFEEEISELKIQPSDYINERGKTFTKFDLTLNQAKQVLMRESKFVRKAMIQYIDNLEKALKATKHQFQVPTSFREALLLAAEQQGVIEEQKKQIEIMKPKEEFFDAVADSKTAISMNDVAKVLGVKDMGRNKMFEFLRKKCVLMSNNTPYQKFVDCGYFRVVEQKYMQNGEQHITTKTLVYQKGVDFIRKMINKHETEI